MAGNTFGHIFTVTSFGEDTRGELYFTDYGTGEVYQIIPQ